MNSDLVNIGAWAQNNGIMIIEKKLAILKRSSALADSYTLKVNGQNMTRLKIWELLWIGPYHGKTILTQHYRRFTLVWERWPLKQPKNPKDWG